MKIMVRRGGQTVTVPAKEGETLFDALYKAGLTEGCACGGFKCGRCSARLARLNKSVLTCETLAADGDELILPERVIAGARAGLGVSFKGGKSGKAVAVDIGTTTLEFCLVDMSDGAIIKSLSRPNPQIEYGADVISRIALCADGRQEELTQAIRSAVNEAISELTDKAEVLMVSGNTAMLHIFAGVDASPLGFYPYEHKLIGSYTSKGNQMGIAADKVVILPSASAFIGSDVIGGAAALELKENCALIDLGTNAEIAIKKDGKLFAASAAAGPALEGYGIECGCAAVKGAVNKVKLNNGNIECETVGNAPPVGLCGSGLIDAVAVLLKTGVIEPSGKVASGVRHLCDKVYISQRDVRAFQLFKSAVRAGLNCVMRAANCAALDKIYLAGALGYYADINSLCEVGLLPAYAKYITVPAGNTSVTAAINALSSEGLQAIERLAENCVTVDLTSDEGFTTEFVENVKFFIGQTRNGAT